MKRTAKDIKGKQELLLVSLNEFYDNKNNIDTLNNILNGEGDKKISLRIIDWFVTNYCKKFNIQYQIKKKCSSPKKLTIKRLNKISKKDDSRYNSNLQQFNVYLDYKSQLRAYAKRHFDPFCRRNRIEYKFNDDTKIITTVGQLNFFRWSIENNVINYIKNNYKKIEEDMNSVTKKEKVKKISKKQSKKNRKKRTPLSTAATKNMNINNYPVIVNFD